MRFPRPSPYRFLWGLALWCLAYFLVVGSGMNIEVEHDQEQKWFTAIAGIMTLTGAVLIWLSPRRESQNP